MNPSDIDSMLRQTLWELDVILANAGVGIALIKNRTVQRCNQRHAEIFGHADPAAMPGVSSLSFYRDEPEYKAFGARAYPVLAAGQTYHEELLMYRRDGERFWARLNGRLINPDDPSEGAIWITEDITARKRAEEELHEAKAALEGLVQQRTEQLRATVAALEQKVAEQQLAEAHIQQLALYDSLTGLPNRILLQDRSQQALDIARRNDEPLAILFLDLDHFKNVNDSLGHRVGDLLLIQFARRLRGALRQQDTVARTGGDEFVLVLPQTDVSGAAHLATKLMDLLATPFTVDAHELVVTPSLGIAMFPGDGDDFDLLCQCADAAMYRAKRDGRHAFRFFTSEMQAQSARALLVENALRRALEREQFSLHYQPQIHLQSGLIRGAEVLLRWEHPELGWVSPAEFIPVAESTGLILAIGEWVLRTAAAGLRAWLDEGLPPITLAINLSAVQFRQPDLPVLVAGVLSEFGLPAELLSLELTEGATLDDPAAAVAMMHELHSLGTPLAIDDFGTGYSSLSYLKKFRLSQLKIDQSFVRELPDKAEDRAIVTAIIRMAEGLGLATLAEGVETAQQLAFLREQGCTDVQGYLFSRPLEPSAFKAHFLARQALLTA